MAAISVGRIVGGLLLVQITGLIVPFAMLHPVAPSKFLAEAAASADQIKVATFLLLANCALALGIALVAAQEFRRYSSPIALLLLGVSGVMFTLQAIDNAHIMSMVDLSRQYVEGNSGDALQALAA